MAVLAEPQTSKGRATRERLISSARAVAISNAGHLEIGWVAEAAGVVPSLVHRYFGSRAGLVSALVDDFYDRLGAEVLDLKMDRHGPWARHERIRLERGVHFHYNDPITVVLYTRLLRDPEVAETENRRINLIIQDAAGNLRRAQKRGELCRSIDPELAAAAMFGAMQRVMVAALGRSPRPRPARVIEILWRQVTATVNIDLSGDVTSSIRRPG